MVTNELWNIRDEGVHHFKSNLKAVSTFVFQLVKIINANLNIEGNAY